MNIIQEEDSEDEDMYAEEVVTVESSIHESQKRLISIQSAELLRMNLPQKGIKAHKIEFIQILVQCN